MKKFWNWKSRKIRDQATGEEIAERVLFLNGTIAEESWFDDDVTPALFKEELLGGSGDITVWINSPGGDCVAAAQIYNMLMEYKGNVTVKIDGIAASAASVIAMAGTKVLMSPVSTMMIHNPATIAFGDKAEMKRAIEMLDAVKESIMNAYEIKTGMNRGKLSHLMDAETWMDAHKAMEMGFADGILQRQDAVELEDMEASSVSMLYSRAAVTNSLMDKIAAKCHIKPPDNENADGAGGSGSASENIGTGSKDSNAAGGERAETEDIGLKKSGADGTAEIEDVVSNGRSCEEIRERLNFIKRFI